QRLPRGGFERRRRAGLAVRRALPAVLHVAVADAQIETVGILDPETFESARPVVRDGIQPALLQLGFDGLRVPRRDAPTEGIDHRHPRSASSTATGTASPSSGTRSTCTRRRVRGRRRRWIRWRRRLISATNLDASPITDV